MMANQSLVFLNKAIFKPLFLRGVTLGGLGSLATHVQVNEKACGKPPVTRGS